MLIWLMLLMVSRNILSSCFSHKVFHIIDPRNAVKHIKVTQSTQTNHFPRGVSTLDRTLSQTPDFHHSDVNSRLSTACMFSIPYFCWISKETFFMLLDAKPLGLIRGSAVVVIWWLLRKFPWGSGLFQRMSAGLILLLFRDSILLLMH